MLRKMAQQKHPAHTVVHRKPTQTSSFWQNARGRSRIKHRTLVSFWELESGGLVTETGKLLQNQTDTTACHTETETVGAVIKSLVTTFTPWSKAGRGAVAFCLREREGGRKHFNCDRYSALLPEGANYVIWSLHRLFQKVSSRLHNFKKFRNSITCVPLTAVR